mmetsp:Transcript_2507/g.11351  ORF Transcript_2507/g.11351 Transcript_2507/m.11351 type:complete len:220 (-) Transcript_2507:565-1224(-)
MDEPRGQRGVAGRGSPPPPHRAAARALHAEQRLHGFTMGPSHRVHVHRPRGSLRGRGRIHGKRRLRRGLQHRGGVGREHADGSRGQHTGAARQVRRRIAVPISRRRGGRRRRRVGGRVRFSRRGGGLSPGHGHERISVWGDRRRVRGGCRYRRLWSGVRHGRRSRPRGIDVLLARRIRRPKTGVTRGQGRETGAWRRRRRAVILGYNRRRRPSRPSRRR